MENNTNATIDKYVSRFLKDVQDILENIRQVIRKAVTQAEEAISYGIPTYKLNGNLVHFAPFKKYIGFYPTSSGNNRVRNILSSYNISRGTVRFPIDEPIPYDLIEMIVKFRVKEVSVSKE